MCLPLLAAVIVAIGLATPVWLKDRSWWRCLIALFLCVTGLILPLIVFYLSAFLTPEWKGGCVHGWLDCFYLGKLAMSPVVLWATAALYASDIYRVEKRDKPWIVLGLLAGAMVASVCLIFGLATLSANSQGMAVWLLVPFYVAIWYGLRGLHLYALSALSIADLLRMVVGSVPFWFASAVWSRDIYSKLPDTDPSCFIVTAATRGHQQLVGPLMEVERNGELRRVNQQLLTFWRLEKVWCNHTPRTHALFRRAYNRVGPVLAGQIRAPWMADLVYFGLKPIELIFCCYLKAFGTNRSLHVERNENT